MSSTKTRQQIADEYGISRKTLSRWLKDVNIVLKGYLVTPKEQEIIYQHLGHPVEKMQKK